MIFVRRTRFITISCAVNTNECDAGDVGHVYTHTHTHTSAREMKLTRGHYQTMILKHQILRMMVLKFFDGI